MTAENRNRFYFLEKIRKNFLQKKNPPPERWGSNANYARFPLRSCAIAMYRNRKQIIMEPAVNSKYGYLTAP